MNQMMLKILCAIKDAITGMSDQLNDDHVIGQPICALVDGNPQIVTPVAMMRDGAVVGKVYLDDMLNEVAGEVTTNEDPCACMDCPDCETDESEQGFDFTEFLTANPSPENSKVNLDDPGFTNAYFDVGLAGWSVADLVAALNASAANAVPPTVPSGIDYSGTTFAVSGTNPNAIVVTAGSVPTSIDLVSLSVSIPLTAI